MGNNKNSSQFTVFVTPDYGQNNNTVTGLYITLDGFIYKEAQMIYKKYTLQLQLLEDEAPLINALNKCFTVGDYISVYTTFDGIKLTACFMITAKMSKFCEEWKQKTLKLLPRMILQNE